MTNTDVSTRPRQRDASPRMAEQRWARHSSVRTSVKHFDAYVNRVARERHGELIRSRLDMETDAWIASVSVGDDRG